MCHAIINVVFGRSSISDSRLYSNYLISIDNIDIGSVVDVYC